jgi:S1-C subfamily serine protease
VELDHPERQQGLEPRRRFPTRIILTALIAIVAAALLAAGLALTKNGSTPIGTGVVVIETNLAYQGGQAAGTGMVLTSSGEILTNNHVIRGATDIKVRVPSTGRSYAAEVVGYDLTDDVAVLQASGAADLKTAPLGSSSSVDVGQSVQAVGNAGGTGYLSHASGTVTGVGRSITVSDDQGGSENLSGLIETNAAVRPGDSGGPLLNSAGQVIGMDTAASAGNDVARRRATRGMRFRSTRRRRSPTRSTAATARTRSTSVAPRSSVSRPARTVTKAPARSSRRSCRGAQRKLPA